MWFLLLLAQTAPSDLEAVLQQPILDPAQPRIEVQVYTASRVPTVPTFDTAAQWRSYADGLRRRILDEIVFRGEARNWRAAKSRVEWLEEIPASGYTLRKLRFEAIPGLWVPALLYQPERLAGRVPVVLNVNGHDGKGKAADYKQLRCINQAKRGMIALNPEWLGMGQLNGQNFSHARMNQLDLCGSSGLAPFYLALARGLDVLVARAVLQNILRLRDQGKCILFSTHIMREVEKLCDRVAVISRGKILASGTLEELRETHQQNDLEELFFQLVS